MKIFRAGSYLNSEIQGLEIDIQVSVMGSHPLEFRRHPTCHYSPFSRRTGCRTSLACTPDQFEDAEVSPRRLGKSKYLWSLCAHQESDAGTAAFRPCRVSLLLLHATPNLDFCNPQANYLVSAPAVQGAHFLVTSLRKSGWMKGMANIKVGLSWAEIKLAVSTKILRSFQTQIQIGGVPVGK